MPLNKNTHPTTPAIYMCLYVVFSSISSLYIALCLFMFVFLLIFVFLYMMIYILLYCFFSYICVFLYMLLYICLYSIYMHYKEIMCLAMCFWGSALFSKNHELKNPTPCHAIKTPTPPPLRFIHSCFFIYWFIFVYMRFSLILVFPLFFQRFWGKCWFPFGFSTLFAGNVDFPYVFNVFLTEILIFLVFFHVFLAGNACVPCVFNVSFTKILIFQRFSLCFPRFLAGNVCFPCVFRRYICFSLISDAVYMFFYYYFVFSLYIGLKITQNHPK